ncbi:MAG: hypothetical protein OM95_08090 [Bdellovibrio sp. ArHS]|uniref:hypothetical protein n=1 Tax=Bdellovibrio sp. ArHS TaxID=1569284 RepID=UPI000583B586|nr:hypothetical protein [Bdellovibrio sp. ArHS]KHD88468.1 MAG: hypothetical protein OM95_08090 [Bdellovibrio sp. ArHS]
MNSFKQALIHLKNHWKYGLLIGALGLMVALILRHIPYVSAFLTAFALLILQHLTDRWMEGKKWQNLSTLKEFLLPFVVTSLILFPTTVLIGSSLGILQSPQEYLSGAPLSLGLFMLGAFFYLVLTHALRYRMETTTGLAEALDIVGLASMKNFRVYFVLSFYLALLLLLAGVTWGLGFLVAFPMLFFSSHYSYNEMKTLFVKK